MFDNIQKPLGVNSLKWLPAESNNDLICMSISDLDFKTPDCVIESIKHSLDNGYFGYKTMESEKINLATCNWFLTQHKWDLGNSPIHLTNRIAEGAKQAIDTFSKEGDGVIVQTPIYPAFRSWINSLGRRVIDNELRRTYDGGWQLDLNQLEKQLSDKNTTMLLLCNPHNPTGRAWSYNELKQIGDLCKKYDVTIVSDDAHCEICRADAVYTPIAQVCPNNKIVTLVSPAKAFGTASLSIAISIFSDFEMMRQVTSNPLVHPCRNPLSIAALVGAYGNGQEYMRQLNQHIDSNFTYLKEQLDIPFKIPEATYLAWLDISFTSKTASEMKDKCRENGVMVIDGTIYGKQGCNFIRVNVGTSKEILKEGLNRIKNTIGLPRYC